MTAVDLSLALFVTMGAHAVGIFMGDFVPVLHFLNVVSFPVHTIVDPMVAFVSVLSTDRSRPRQCADSQRGGESGGRKTSKRNLGHDCVFRKLAHDQP
jgi:hypothetical protein